MEETTRCRSSKAASLFDEHVDGATAADAVGDADALVGNVEEEVFEGVVVGKIGIPPPEASVGVVVGAEGVDEAVGVDEGVVDE